MDKQELKQTVEDARGGNTEAFERLYEEYRERLFFFAVKNVGSREAAEDVVSETFVAAMEGIDSLREGEAFGGWLYSIAYRKCLSVKTAQSKAVSDEGEREKLLESAGLDEPMELPEDYAVSEQTRRTVRDIIDALAPDQRSAVILYYYNELSAAEVGKSLGISENAARQKLSRARKAIKKGIEKRFGKGAVLLAVPLSAALNSALESSYVKAVTSGARVKGMGIGARIATVGAIAAVAVALPIGISKLGGGGGYRPEDRTSSDEYIIDYNNSVYDPDNSSEVPLIKREPNAELGAYGEGRFKFLCDTPKINAQEIYILKMENLFVSSVTDSVRKKCADALDAVYGVKASPEDVSTVRSELYPENDGARLRVETGEGGKYSANFYSNASSFVIMNETPEELYEPLGEIADKGEWEKYTADNYPDREYKMFDGRSVTIAQIIDLGEEYLEKLRSYGAFDEGQDCFLKYITVGSVEQGTDIMLYYRMTRYGLEVDDGARLGLSPEDALRMRAPRLTMEFVYSDRVTAINSYYSGKVAEKQKADELMTVGEAIVCLEKGLAKNINSTVYEVGLMYCCPQNGQDDGDLCARPMWVFALSDPMKKGDPQYGFLRTTAYVDAVSGDIYYYDMKQERVEHGSNE